MSPNVSKLIGQANQDAGLAAQLREAAGYSQLAEVASQAGFPVQEDDLRSAFRQRNSWAIAPSLIRAGLIPPQPLPEIPAWNQDKWDAVCSLDLSAVVRQVTKRSGWDLHRAASAEIRYRRFLYLAVAVPGLNVSPTVEIDELWHQHILNTQKYSDDCRHIKGEIIHHLPCDDSQPDEDLEPAFFQTWLAYEAIFDEPLEESIGEALLARWSAAAVETPGN